MRTTHSAYHQGNSDERPNTDHVNHGERGCAAQTAGGGRSRRARAETADLDPRRETDAQIAACLQCVGLLLAERIVAGQSERLIQCALVVTRVVDRATTGSILPSDQV